jgi:hypothetical protein
MRSKYPETPGFVRGSQTSEDAAYLLRPHRLEKRFLLALVESMGNIPPGLTDHEISKTLDLPVTTRPSPRRSKLRRAGLVFDSGNRRLNPETGRNQTVWFPTSTKTSNLSAATHATPNAVTTEEKSPRTPGQARGSGDTMLGSPPSAHSLMDTVDAAEVLGVSPRTLGDWRWRGGGPVFFKLGRRMVRYRMDDLLSFALQSERKNTASDKMTQ